MKADSPAFLIGYEGIVEPDWIDINDHMNITWYDHVFDIADLYLIEMIGLTDPYILATGLTTYRVEKKIRYERELLRGDRLRIHSRVSFTDERIIKQSHELMNVTRNVRAASAEFTSIHVDLSVRKAARILDPVILEPLRRLVQAHTICKDHPPEA